MFDEVDQFIRRVRELQQQQQGGGQRQPAPPPRPTPAPPRPSATRQPFEIVEAEPVDAEIIEAEPVHQAWPASTLPLSKHFENADFVQRAEHMADSVEIADDRMDAHIHNAFDHQVGHLSHEETKAAADLNMFHPQDVAQSLRDPASFRRAIIVSEILNRPTHRWK
ncbi:MAG: hypothetical protein KDA38_15905 [Planctomycetales bacterium]|nr:hypothetical protein [Planctomycetales bacterium]